MSRAMKLRALAFFGFAAIASMACVAPTEAGEEVGTDEAAYDTFRAPTQHGELQLGLESGGTFTADERFHAFDFEIQSNSNVRLYTAPAANKGRLVDTVIYLYRQGPAGFGASIASSDNARSTAWSEIRRTLSPGVTVGRDRRGRRPAQTGMRGTAPSPRAPWRLC